MSNEMFTQLPSVVSSTMADIICAVQGNVSVQETVGQIFSLMLSNVILENAGNPNGVVAGVTFQLCYDATNGVLYICTVSGNSSTAVWTLAGVPSSLTNGQLYIGSTGHNPVAAVPIAGPGISISTGPGTLTISSTASVEGWTDITGTTQAIVPDSGYTTDNAGLVTLLLPTVAAYGTGISIIGKGAGGWSITQNAGQNIQVGSVSSTVGVGGSVSSTNRFDSLNLICTVANTTWSLTGAPQGILTIV